MREMLTAQVSDFNLSCPSGGLLLPLGLRHSRLIQHGALLCSWRTPGCWLTAAGYRQLCRELLTFADWIEVLNTFAQTG